ncbi:MAG: F0F1 ATP synthase subunit A [Ruminococcaceae bacterium]|nr:F0F1 ATP synthase subunit A [Oscillospiraceae bacterium]
MKPKNRRFMAVDILLLMLTILPIVAGITFKVLTTPLTEGIVISGARIYWTIPMPIQNLLITESQINSAIVIITVLGLCLYLTHGIRAGVVTKRQLLAEWIVEKVDGMIHENMGEYFAGFAPFVTAILALSGFSSLLSLFGLYAPTSDLNIVAGWAILVFILITYYKCKAGLWYYVKSFGEPVKVLAPMNLISEIATPFSMAFRHYGNILSGSIVAVLIGALLQSLSAKFLGWLPGFLGEIPFLQIGIPALLSVYFDVFGACLQAYIFAVLTMLYVSNGFPMDEYEKRKLRKLQKKKNVQH